MSEAEQHPAPQTTSPELPPEPPPAPPPRTSRVSLLALLAVLLAAGLAAWTWIDTREQIGVIQEEVARRLRNIEVDAAEARSLAQQGADTAREGQARLAELESRLGEWQSQQVALEALYEDLSRNRDEWQLAEIEQVLAIASQQLQLAGNVRAALLALQLADARLARADRPQFEPIRRAIASDIERLQALPVRDVPAISARIEGVIAAVASLPLALEERVAAEAAPKPVPADDPAGFLARLGAEIWDELRQLVVVRRMDRPEAPLLAPTQAYFLRENLRLRLLNARLSLLARDEAGYRADLRAAREWIERYFDADAKATTQALAEIEALLGTSISFELPAISGSLEAVRNFKSRGERKGE